MAPIWPSNFEELFVTAGFAIEAAAVDEAKLLGERSIGETDMLTHLMSA